MYRYIVIYRINIEFRQPNIFQKNATIFRCRQRANKLFYVLHTRSLYLLICILLYLVCQHKSHNNTDVANRSTTVRKGIKNNKESRKPSSQLEFVKRIYSRSVFLWRCKSAFWWTHCWFRYAKPSHIAALDHLSLAIQSELSPIFRLKDPAMH